MKLRVFSVKLFNGYVNQTSRCVIIYFQLSKFIGAIYRQSKSEINQQIQQLGVRATQGDLLLFVHDNPGLSQKEIAHLMVLDPSLVGRDIQELISAGFLKRRQVQHGHLTNLIFMTSKGIALTSSIQRFIEHWWLTVFDQAVGIDKQVLTQQLESLYHQVINTGIGNKE